MIRILLAAITVAIIGCIFFLPRKHQAGHVNLVKPITQVGSGWHHDYEKWLQVNMTAEGDALRVDIPQTDKMPEHAQCYFDGAPLKDGSQYRLRFEAKADKQFIMRVQAAVIYRGYPNAGLDERVPLVTEWLPYTYTFTAGGMNGRTARIPLFLLGTDTGTVWIKNVVLEEI
jgi:hypothetical protein